MLKAMIIDDEPIQVRSLQMMIERADCGVEVVGSANDGATGLSLIQTLLPDVVFVDISMPVMDGLQLIECLRHDGNDVPVVILSGYKEFDYAKRAVALSVVDYLVKPINPVEFKSFLLKISNTITQNRHEKIRTVLSDAIRSGNTSPNVPEWMQSDRFDCWKICFGVFAYYRKMGVDAEAEKLRKALTDVLNNCCGNDVWLFETRYPNEFLLFLSSGDEGNHGIGRIYEACKECLPDKIVTVALGGQALSANELRSATKKANAVLQSGAVFASSGLLLSEASASSYSKEDVDPLCKLLKAKDTANAGRLLQQLLRRCREKEYTQADLAVTLKSILQSSKSIELQTEADYHVGILLEKSADYDALLKNLEELLFTDDSHLMFKLNGKSSKAIIDTVATYLVTHATEKISLQSVAEEFGFNYTYLSYLFKKCYGRSPSEYLTQCRIDQAKHMLTQSEEYSIKEISSAVGYDDPYYFSRIFKTTTGLSPSDFRKQNG